MEGTASHGSGAQAARGVALRWSDSRSYHHSDFSAERIAAERKATISVCLPARNEVRTIAGVLHPLISLKQRGAVDQVVVADDSIDGTAEIAAELGAEVHDQRSLRPEFGAVQGKGDAMWRALSVLTGDVVCFLDADSEQVGEHYLCGLAGPIVCGLGADFVKGFYRRPFRIADQVMPSGGGRVTELTARPLLNLFYPELAGFRQPLAGEVAARRDLLERLPFVTGYGVDIALLIDTYRRVGLDAMAQVDLDVRQNDHQGLDELAPMAYAVLRSVASRLEREGRLTRTEFGDFLKPDGSEIGVQPMEVAERPPIRELSAKQPA